VSDLMHFSPSEFDPRTDEYYMKKALVAAAEAFAADEVPVGAILVAQGEIIGRAFNQRETLQDPTAHAEILALTQAASALGRWRLTDTTMYVTLEPCSMCAGALVNARVKRLVYGAKDPKAGFAGSLGNIVQDGRLNHRLEMTSGVLETECATILRDFFLQKRIRE